MFCLHSGSPQPLPITETSLRKSEVFFVSFTESKIDALLLPTDVYIVFIW